MYRAEFSATLAYFGLNIVTVATPFHLLKILIAYFDLSTPKNYYSREKCLDILYRKEISAILAYFGLNLVAMATAMATALALLNIQIAYLNSPTSKTLLFMRKMCWCLAQSWNQCTFGLFLPKFGCHGNSLCPLENADSIFVSADHENPTIHAKRVSISCTILADFAQIWLSWQLPLVPWKFR